MSKQEPSFKLKNRIGRETETAKRTIQENKNVFFGVDSIEFVLKNSFNGDGGKENTVTMILCCADTKDYVKVYFNDEIDFNAPKSCRENEDDIYKCKECGNVFPIAEDHPDKKCVNTDGIVFVEMCKKCYDPSV